MRNLSLWYQSFRPKTLVASISPILIGTTMAYVQGHFHYWIFLFTLLTGLGIQISTNLINDLYDFLKGADTAARKGPVRVAQSQLFSIFQIKRAILVLFFFTAACGTLLIYRGGLFIGLLVAFSLLFAFSYTAGPFPLAYLGLSEFFVLVFFGPVATGATYYLQTLHVSKMACIAGLSPGLLSCAILVINNLRDVEEDRCANKKTLVVRFGIPFGKGQYMLFLFFACLLPLFFFSSPLLLLTPSLLCFLPACLLCTTVWSNQDPYAYNPLFGKTATLLWLYSVAFCLSHLV